MFLDVEDAVEEGFCLGCSGGHCFEDVWVEGEKGSEWMDV